MKRHISITLGMLLLFLIAAGFGGHVFAPVSMAQSQNPQNASPATAPATTAPAQQAQTPAGSSIKAETREVRVDVVVTDKKGDYVQDLTTKDFRLFEDNKEQPINTFSFGASPNAAPESQRHYMVLFFDNSSMDLSDQPRARAAAGKFIDAYANSDRIMSVVNFGGTLQIVQNFTADPALLKQAVSGISFSAVSTGATASNGMSSSGLPAGLGSSSPGGLRLSNPESNFGTYSMLLSIRQMAKNLASIPGRKSLILFTAGFELSYERYSELTATVDACNKANVAVYPLDVRGLVAPTSLLRFNETPNAYAADAVLSAYRTTTAGSSNASSGASESRLAAEMQNTRARLQLSSYHPASSAPYLPTGIASQQHGGGGHPPSGGGGGGNPPAGGGGNPPKTGGNPPPKTGGNPPPTTNPGHNQPSVPFNNNNQNLNQARQIIPPFPKTASSNQQVMYALASGTGGFPILNTNDLMPGLEKIAREQSEYYLLGYAPADSPAGSCHTLRVKVERGGTNVRARSGFCNVPSSDPLAGKPIEKELEMHAAANGTASTAPAAATGSASAPSANSAVSLQAPFFYTSPTEARVHLTMEIPSSSIDFEKVKGKYHADVNVLGIAYHQDGTVASRFSDEVTYDLEKDQWQAFLKTPMHYENQFSVAPGQYRLSVALNGGGQNFISSEIPLAIDTWDGKKLSLSGLAMSNQFTSTGELGGTFEADLLADRTPLVVGKIQLTPSADNHFKKTDKVAIYAQVYAPHLADPNPPTVVCTFIVTDLKTGKTVATDTGIDLTQFVQKGNSMIPVGLKLPMDNLPPGEYRLKMQAAETGRVLSQVRSVNFVVE